jgi:hypothetical protein
MLWSLLLFALLPMGTDTAWFLNDKEKEVAKLRLIQDSVANLHSPFKWKEAFGEFYTIHGWLRVFMAITSGVILTANANFLAIIVKRLQFDVVKTNLVSRVG